MRRAGARFLLGAGLILVITLFVTGGFAQIGEDRRNNSEEYYDAVNGANCMSHHDNEGMRPMDIGLKQRYSQLPIGEPVDLEMVIINPWKQQIQQVAVIVNVSKAPNVRVITPDSVNDTESEAVETLESGATYKSTFNVAAGATEMYVAANVRGQPFGADLGLGLDRGELELTVRNNANTQFQTDGSRYSRHLKLAGEELVNAGTGEFLVDVTWTSDIDAQMEVEIVTMVNYTSSQTEFAIRMPDTYRIDADSTGSVPITIVIESEEEAVLDFRVESVSYWAHSPTDGASRDDGLFYRFTTMKLRGGDSFVRLDSAFGPQPVGPSADLYGIFTRVLGFVAALLIPLSMLTGGIFGKASRRWLNKMTGGAKKRVLWHSAMSWMIISVASFHFILALIEEKFLWTKGLLWGGVGWVLLISLGFTGYYQVRMIKRWNYKVWRHTHLWSAVAVLVFTLVHLTLDGSDVQMLRDALPDWHEKLIWP